MKKSTKIIIAIVIIVIALAVMALLIYIKQNHNYWNEPGAYCSLDHCPKLWCEKIIIDCPETFDPHIFGEPCVSGPWCNPRYN